MAKALVIEPKDALREQVAQVLRDKGIFVSLAKKASEATAMLETSPVDLVLMDIEMPEVQRNYSDELGTS
jgi:CheY-like chemotaxis protein